MESLLEDDFTDDVLGNVVGSVAPPRRTRSGRAVATVKRGRGRKRTTAARPTRATRNTRAAQPDDDEEEEEEDSPEESQDMELNSCNPMETEDVEADGLEADGLGAIQEVLNEPIEPTVSSEDGVYGNGASVEFLVEDSNPAEENGIVTDFDVVVPDFLVEEDTAADSLVEESLPTEEAEVIEPSEDSSNMSGGHQQAQEEVEAAVQELSEAAVPELSESPPPCVGEMLQSSMRVAGGLRLRSLEPASEEEGMADLIDANQAAAQAQMEVDEESSNLLAAMDANSEEPTMEDVLIVSEVHGDGDSDCDTAREAQAGIEPDTEMVSEDDLPSESKEPLDTEAVSDDELPNTSQPVDLPETEEVSEDELPPEKSDKKKKAKQSKSSKKGTSSKKSRSEGQKRKLLDTGSYDPSSPTSENSEQDSPSAKKVAIADGEDGATPKAASKKKALPELEKYWKAVKEDTSDFTGWTYLLQYVDQENDLDAAREAYDAFLSHYPYCYGYWRKYADYEKRKSNKEKCEEVFDRGLKAIPLSVDLWVHYLNYCKTTLADDEDALRGQFERAIKACGLEFRSDRLWESYIKWEQENKRLQLVITLYDRLLATPTQSYVTHFENFQALVNSNPPQKLLTVDEFLEERREVLQQLKQYEQPKAVGDVAAPPGEEGDVPPGEETAEKLAMSNDEETTALREKIIAHRRKIHKATTQMVSDRWVFEEGIKRPYFHVKPLERCQLKNWREYLDYEMEQASHERIVVLFERCLIACALYDDMWQKFIRYLESGPATEEGVQTEKIRDVYRRACTIHHPKKPSLHLAWAIFEEMQLNYDQASEILTGLDRVVPHMIQVAYRRINLERRRGQLDAAGELYEHYMSTAKTKLIANNLTIKYARFCCKVKNDVDLAISILNKAIEKDKENPRLYLQLVDLSLQKWPLVESEVVAVLDRFLENKDADAEQKVLFAQRKVEFLEDFGSNVGSVQKAQDEFHRYCKLSKEKKKKLMEDAKSDSSKKSKSDPASATGTTSSPSTQMAAPPSAASQYPPNYAQTGYSGQQPAGGYQASQYPQGPGQQQAYGQYNQQYPNQSDPNYANYQNWGYSQPGYGGYNQGWTGNYNYY